MQNFKRITESIDIVPFIEEIEQVDGVWGEQTGRQKVARVQREAKAIPIRGLRKSFQGSRAPRDVHESRWTSGSVRFPVTRRFLEDFARRRDGLMSRAKIVALPAGCRVYPHIDRGEYYRLRDRYHLVLRSAAGSWLKAGVEEVRMQSGEVWWFDNKAVHEAFNDGDQDRIHFIFDLLPRGRVDEAFGPGADLAECVA